jgi:hypothetical protein
MTEKKSKGRKGVRRDPAATARARRPSKAAEPKQASAAGRTGQPARQRQEEIDWSKVDLNWLWWGDQEWRDGISRVKQQHRPEPRARARMAETLLINALYLVPGMNPAIRKRIELMEEGGLVEHWPDEDSLPIVRDALHIIQHLMIVFPHVFLARMVVNGSAPQSEESIRRMRAAAPDADTTMKQARFLTMLGGAVRSFQAKPIETVAAIMQEAPRYDARLARLSPQLLAKLLAKLVSDDQRGSSKPRNALSLYTLAAKLCVSVAAKEGELGAFDAEKVRTARNTFRLAAQSAGGAHKKKMAKRT